MKTTLGGIVHTILEVPHVLDSIVEIEGSKLGLRGQLSGVCMHEHALILIGRDQSVPQRARTLLHEVSHAVLPELSERKIRKLENGLYPFLVRCGYRYPEELLIR